MSDLRRGTPAVEPDPRIAAAEPKMMSMNAVPSIFFCNYAASILTRERVDTVIVTGSLTGGMRFNSVIDMFHVQEIQEIRYRAEPAIVAVSFP